MRLLLPLLFLSILAGCTAEVQRLQAVSTPLTPDTSFYVPLCADGKHDGHQQVASGLMMSQLLSAELKARAQRVERGTREENQQLALISARERDLKYVAFPAILDWQDDATPMASVPDRVKVRIDIIDVANANIIDAVVLQKQTSDMAVSKTPPQELLAAPLQEYAAALIQPKADESKRSFWRRMQAVFSSDDSAQTSH